MSTSRRLTAEYREFLKDPVDLIQAKPQDDNIFIWHFILEGPPNTPYSGGQYYGIMTFPRTYPMNAPSVKVITPNGRFESGTVLCITFMDHRNSKWNSKWSVSSIFGGLLRFMAEESTGYGSIYLSADKRRALALSSREFNNNSVAFKRHFPDVVELNYERIEKSKKAINDETQNQATVPTTSPTTSAAAAAPKSSAATAAPTTVKPDNKKSKRQKVKFFFTNLLK